MSQDAYLKSLAAAFDKICPPKTVQDLDRKPTPQTAFQKYVSSGGNECFNCHSSDLSGSEVEMDTGWASQHITCQECGAEWDDEYELTNVINFTLGKTALSHDPKTEEG